MCRNGSNSPSGCLDLLCSGARLPDWAVCEVGGFRAEALLEMRGHPAEWESGCSRLLLLSVWTEVAFLENGLAIFIKRLKSGEAHVPETLLLRI